MDPDFVDPQDEEYLFGLNRSQVKSVAIALLATAFVAFKRGQRSQLELLRDLVTETNNP